MSTSERVVVTECDKANCLIKKCECSCHTGGMDHMFACCMMLKCTACGAIVRGTVVDDGT